MFSPNRNKARAPETELMVVPITPVVLPVDSGAQLAHDAARPTRRPRRMREDVWTVLREYQTEGGITDLAEDVATLSALEAKIVDNNQLSAVEQIAAVRQLAKERAAIKVNYQKMQIELKRMISVEGFASFMEDVYEILQRNIADPSVLARIGQDLYRAAQTLKPRGT